MDWLMDQYDYALFDTNPDSLIKQRLKIMVKDLIKDTTNTELSKTNFPKKFYPSFISKEQIKNNFIIDPNQGWKNFYSLYPKAIGYMELSKIKYDNDLACVYVDFHFNSLGASGDLFIFKKIKNNWVLITELNIIKS